MKKPIVALMYDFDKTLSSRDMQEYSLIPAFNMTAREFWAQSDALAAQCNMDYILSTMYLILKLAHRDGVDISREALQRHGQPIEFNKGVDTWFDRVNAYGEQLGLDVRHYIISCGLKPMIEGSSIAKNFHNIFACDYSYENDQPVWPAIALNYSSKIQFLYRINKGVEDIFEHDLLNKHTPHASRPVPFSNMIYVGDGMTDVPSMKLTRLNGGYSVGVYQTLADSKYLVDDDRVDFYVKADYSAGSDMEQAVMAILDKINISDRFRSMANVAGRKVN
jgi:2-hydroxy-3-keto-5-methylthiopentenyl-1-phosphate phosphatase